MSLRPVAVALLVVVAFSVVGAAATTGEPSIDVFAPENVVEPGEETAITLEFRNSGSVEDDDGPPGAGADVTEARNVSVELHAGDAPVAVKTDTTPLPALGQDAFVSESFTIAVDEDAPAGSYELDAEITYDYVPEVDSEDGPDDEVTVTETETVVLVVEERARFAAETVASDVRVGETGTVEVDVENLGVENASDAVVSLDSRTSELTPVDGEASRYVGDWSVGETVTVDAGFTLEGGALARTYPVTATVEFRDDDGVDRSSRELRLGAEARDRTFVATDVESTLLVGDDGEVRVTLENEGGDVEDAVISLDSPDGELEPVTDDSRRFVGDWAGGERTTATARFEVDGDATPGDYPISAVVDYRDGGGGDRLSREVRVGATVDDRQSFDARTVTSDLRVGEDGTVSGYVINEGPRPAEGVVVAVDDGEEEGLVPTLGTAVGLGPNVAVGESQYYVGSLAPGESSRFALEFGVTDGAEPGPRLVETEVRYRNANDDVRTTDVVDVPVEIGDSREEFALEAQAATVEVGGTDRLEVAVTNTYGETLTDVEAKLFTNDPLERGDDEAFIPRLEPNETVTIAFELSAAEGATPQSYPARIDFRYDDADGDGRLSDTYRIPVSVVEPVDEGLALGWIAVGLTALAAVAGAGWRFRARLAAALPWTGAGSAASEDRDVGTEPGTSVGEPGDDAAEPHALAFDDSASAGEEPTEAIAGEPGGGEEWTGGSGPVGGEPGGGSEPGGGESVGGSGPGGGESVGDREPAGPSDGESTADDRLGSEDDAADLGFDDG